MAETDGDFTTDDMAFATVLIMNGYNPVMRRPNPRRELVVWSIPADDWDEGIEQLEQDYLSGACLVEPRRFIREIRDVRHRVYAFLGVENKPRGVRIRRSPSV